MSQIPTPSHDLPLDVWLVLVLLGLSPAMLGSWLESRFRAPLARLPLDGYSLVLIAVVTGTFAALGTPPRLLPASGAPGTAILVGLLAGVAAVAIEHSVSRVRGAPRRTVQAKPRWTPEVPADVPTGGEVVWRLQGRDSARPVGLASLLAPAVLEEMVYRQALLVLLSQAVGIAAAAALSTLSFGLIHISFGVRAVVSKAVIGAILAAMVLSGGGLLSAIVAHSVLNATVYFVLTRRIQWLPVIGAVGARA